jgi:hypothetical protein
VKRLGFSQHYRNWALKVYLQFTTSALSSRRERATVREITAHVQVKGAQVG